MYNVHFSQFYSDGVSRRRGINTTSINILAVKEVVGEVINRASINISVSFSGGE